MRIAYFAEDGTEFETKEECKEYEDKFIAPLNDIIAFDDNNEILPYSQECNFFDKVAFFRFKNSDAVNAFHNEFGRVSWFNNETGEHGVRFEENTNYYYDDDYDEFGVIEGTINHYSEKIESLKAGKALIEKAIG